MAQLPVDKVLRIRLRFPVVAAVLLTGCLLTGCRTPGARSNSLRTVSSPRPAMVDEMPADTGPANGTDATGEVVQKPIPSNALSESPTSPEVTQPYESPSAVELPDTAVPLIGELTPIPPDPAAVPSATIEESAPAPPDPEVSPEQTLKEFGELGGSIEVDDAGDVRAIDLSFTAITAEQLRGLAQFKSLQELDLTGTTTDDSSIAVIAGLSNLRSLKLKGTRISDTGLKQLATLSEVKLLDLSRTAITDDGLSEAAAWKQLNYLSLNNTSITDTGLLSLRTLNQLKGLNLVRSKTTPEGVAALKAAVPGCLIISDSPDAPEPEQDENREVSQSRVRTTSVSGAAGLEAADSQLPQLMELAAMQPELAIHLSTIYSGNDRWIEAAQILHAAAQSNDQDPALQFRLGEALAHSGFTNDALRCFRQSVGDAAAHYNMGLILYENLLRDCEQHFEKSVQADPGLDVAALRLKYVRRELAMSRNLPAPARPEGPGVTSTFASHNGTPWDIHDELPTGSMVTTPTTVPEVIPGTHVYRSISSRHQTRSGTSSPYIGSALPAWLQTTNSPADLWHTSVSRADRVPAAMGTHHSVPEF